MLAAASPRARAERGPGQLAGEAWIGFPLRPDGPRSRTTRHFASLSPRVVWARQKIIAIDSLTAQKRMVEAGFGLALLPESSVDEELRAGTLRALRSRPSASPFPW